MFWIGITIFGLEIKLQETTTTKEKLFRTLVRMETMAETLFCSFNLPEINPDELSPAVWAYVGDAVYELFVRSSLVAVGPNKTKNLHKDAVAKVRASYQAEMIKLLEPHMTAGEQEIIKRGRNVKSGHVPAGSDVITYRHSTAFEALIGYLYLSHQHVRLSEIFIVIAQNGGESYDKS